MGEDGELVYIKLKSSIESTENAKAPLLENCETFKLRNNFKRSSTRRSTRGKNLYLKWFLSQPKHHVHCLLNIGLSPKYATTCCLETPPTTDFLQSLKFNRSIEWMSTLHCTFQFLLSLFTLERTYIPCGCWFYELFSHTFMVMTWVLMVLVYISNSIVCWHNAALYLLCGIVNQLSYT